MATKEKLVQVSLRFPESLWKHATELAAKEDLSFQQVCTRALREYVKQGDIEAQKRAFLESAALLHTKTPKERPAARKHVAEIFEHPERFYKIVKGGK